MGQRLARENPRSARRLRSLVVELQQKVLGDKASIAPARAQIRDGVEIVAEGSLGRQQGGKGPGPADEGLFAGDRALRYARHPAVADADICDASALQLEIEGAQTG